MKKKLLIPAESQSERFSDFIKELAAQFSPLHILKFGEINTNKNAYSSFMEEQKSATFHYYLLMVIEGTTRIEHGVQDFVNTHFSYGKITILVHSRKNIEQAIAENNRFFINVFNTGSQLYSHDGTFNLFPEYKLDKKLSLEKAQKHMSHRLSMAQGFLDGAEECYSNQLFNVSVFMLHQTIEQSCIALIRVFTAYRSDMHHLGKLLDLCACFSERPRDLFLLGNTENGRLLEILIRSYSHARYRDNFNVEMEDANQLYSLGCAFLNLTRDLCEYKINQLSLECEREISEMEEADHE